MDVLYVLNNGALGGANRSLYELIVAFPPGCVNPKFIIPRGNIISKYKKLGEVISIPGITQFDNTKYGHYKGKRWFILIRELIYIIPTIYSIIKAKMKWDKISIIHFNEITLLFPLIFCRLLFRRNPIILHVRSVQNDKVTMISKFVNKLIFKYTNIIVCIDETVCMSLPDCESKMIIHNGINWQKKGNKQVDDESDKSLILGYVGNFLKEKGILNLLECVKIGIEQRLNIELHLLGYKEERVSMKLILLKKFGYTGKVDQEVCDFIQSNNLTNKIKIIPFSFEIYDMYSEIDVLCFPSVFNACGRPVFEAALLGKPSIVAIDTEITDTIINNITGLCIKNNSPFAILEAIKKIYNDRAFCKRMGKNAQKMAEENFNISKNSRMLLETYISQLEF